MMAQFTDAYMRHSYTMHISYDMRYVYQSQGPKYGSITKSHMMNWNVIIYPCPRHIELHSIVLCSCSYLSIIDAVLTTISSEDNSLDDKNMIYKQRLLVWLYAVFTRIYQIAQSFPYFVNNTIQQILNDSVFIDITRATCHQNMT